jgi:hypothetical protein
VPERRSPFVVGAVLGAVAGLAWLVAVNIGRAFSGAHVRVDQTPRRILIEVAALVLVVAGPTALVFVTDRDGTRTRMALVLGCLLVMCGSLRLFDDAVPERLIVQTSLANAGTIVVGAWVLASAWLTRRRGAIRLIIWVWVGVHLAAAAALVVVPAAPVPHGPPGSGTAGHAAASR